MVEFRFDIRPLFKQPIVRVSSNLLPHTFKGDRRQALDATSKMSEIIDKLGQLSAISQKLNKPVTTAQRLRMADNQSLYLLADVDGGNNGSVVGILKIGTKDLYLFDGTGQTRKVDKTPCILDFYIHESRQRAGLGKDMFETMLSEEQWTPLKCSVDRPSEKLLAFLKKHYGLERVIPQANNFVLYEGFFDDDRHRMENQHQQQQRLINGMHINNSPNTQLFGAPYVSDNGEKRRMRPQDSPPQPGAQVGQISAAGRYGARRPTCSMAEKTGSEVSLSPSQAAEQAKLNAKKNPLDALSRMSIKHETIPKRSGLQDVDDDYFKTNVFTKKAFPRHFGLADDYGSATQARIMSMNAAAAQQPMTPTESSMKLKNTADGSGGDPQSQASAQGQQQQQQQQQQAQQGQQQHGQQHQHQHGQQGYSHAQSAQMQCKNQTFNANQPNIIHNNGTIPKRGDVESSSLNSPRSVDDAVEALGAQLEDLQTNPHSDGNAVDGEIVTAEISSSNPPPDAVGSLQSDEEHVTSSPQENNRSHMPPQQEQASPVVTDAGSGDHFMNMKKPATFQLSKQHTGMKNMSYGVGMAVTPTNKMEFDQEAREEFGVVKINRPLGSKLNSPSAPAEHMDAMSTISSSGGGEGLTDQGYYDLKFYHNKLW